MHDVELYAMANDLTPPPAVASGMFHDSRRCSMGTALAGDDRSRQRGLQLYRAKEQDVTFLVNVLMEVRLKLGWAGQHGPIRVTRVFRRSAAATRPGRPGCCTFQPTADNPQALHFSTAVYTSWPTARCAGCAWYGRSNGDRRDLPEVGHES